MADGYGISTQNLFSSEDPFKDAAEFTETTGNFVVDQIEALADAVGLGDVEGTLQMAETAITNLGNLSDLIHNLPIWDVADPDLEPRLTTNFAVPDIDPGYWGKIDDFTVDNDITIDLPAISDVTIPKFDFEIAIDIPPAPADKYIAEPGNPPEAPDLEFPEKITVTLPDEKILLELNIPDFVSPTLPDFSPTYPTFIKQDISTLIDWQEPIYTEEVIDEVKLQITRFFAGGSGIDPDIEESIFARGRDREDRVVMQSIQQAMDEWANKGFTAPPGMLAKRLDNIREEGTLKKLGLNREMVIKVHQDEIDNLRFAVQQGIAAEELYVRMFLAKVERLFEVQKLSVQWQIDLYNMILQVFLAEMEAVKIQAQVYEVQIRAAIMEIEVFKALVDVEKVKAEINKTLIDSYVAEISAREAMIRMYGEQVKAVGIEADVFNTQVQAYKGEVEAYGSRVAADKTRFDAYASRIRGEGAKADILASEARAYAAEVQGIETGVKAEVAALEGAVSGIEVEIRNFEAIARGMVAKAQVQLGQIQANVAGSNANTQRFIAETGAEEAASKVEIEQWRGWNAVNLEIFKANVVEFQAKLDLAVKEIELLASTQKSAGDLAATITAGGMAALHVGANISGSSQVGASGNLGYSNSAAQQVSCSTSNTSSLSYVADAPISHDCPTFLTDGSTSIGGGYFGT